jgi:hypothetical protein
LSLQEYSDGRLIRQQVLAPAHIAAISSSLSSPQSSSSGSAGATQSSSSRQQVTPLGDVLFLDHSAYDLLVQLQLGIRWSVTSAALDYTSPAAMHSQLQPPDYATTVKQVGGCRCVMSAAVRVATACMAIHLAFLLCVWVLILLSAVCARGCACGPWPVCSDQIPPAGTYMKGCEPPWWVLFVVCLVLLCSHCFGCRNSHVLAAEAHPCTQLLTSCGKITRLQLSGTPGSSLYQQQHC